MRKFFALVLFIFIGLGWAQANPLDSIGTKVINGKTYIQYRVEPGETVYSIAKKYKVSIQDIIDVNPEVSSGLKANSIILVPYTPPEDNKVSYHIVLSGETLYKIATQYGITVTQLKKWNNLRSDNINIGQRLRVIPSENYEEPQQEYIPPPPPPKEDTVVEVIDVIDVPKPNYDTLTEEEANPEVVGLDSASQAEFNKQMQLEREAKERARMDSIALALAPKEYDSTANLDTALKLTDVELADINYKSNRTVLSSGEIVDNGGCEIIEDEEVDQTRNYCYHPDAPIGTIIMITNPENGRSVFVRVIGNYDPTPGNYVIIKITAEAAKKLGVSGEYFVVNISYKE